MLERAPEAIELRDDELVALARDPQGLVELGAAGELAAGLVDEDLIAASGQQRVALAIRVLVARGDPPVADDQRTEAGQGVTLMSTRVALHRGTRTHGPAANARWERP